MQSLAGTGRCYDGIVAGLSKHERNFNSRFGTDVVGMGTKVKVGKFTRKRDYDRLIHVLFVDWLCMISATSCTVRHTHLPRCDDPESFSILFILPKRAIRAVNTKWGRQQTNGAAEIERAGKPKAAKNPKQR